MRNTIFIMILSTLLIAHLGCSSGNPVNNDLTCSLNPEISLPQGFDDNTSGNRDFLGSWEMKFDLENQLVGVVSTRQIANHYEVSKYIPYPSVSVISVNPLTGVWDLDVKINNNSPFNVYDARLILFTDNYGSRLMNPDSWTSLWDIPGGSIINPFKAYAKSISNRMFASQSQYSERLQVFLPSGSTQVKFAIDACFPSNCKEPYLIENFVHHTLAEKSGSSTYATVDVSDWQNDVQHVWLYCPAVTGEPLSEFSHVSHKTWKLQLFNNTGASAGSYAGFMIAESSGVKLYKSVNVTVSEQTIAKWTFLLYFWDADFTPWVSVNVNEMECVGSIPDELNIIMLREEDFGLDRYLMKIVKDPDGYNGQIISPRLDDHGEVILPGDLKMGDAATLVRFLNWGIREYPAEHYGIILFGHGSGPFGIQPPEYPWLSFVNGMQVWTLRDGLLEVLAAHPEIEKFEFLHFESCLMGWIETAYGLKDVVNVGCASEMVMSGCTAEYKYLLEYVEQNLRTLTPHDFSRVYIDSYLMTDGTMTLAAWDTNILKSDVLPALDIFATELINALPSYRAEIESCRAEVGSWGAWCSDPESADLGYFAECVINRSATFPASLVTSASNLRNAIEETVYYHGHNGTGTGCWYNETGLQIWFPEDYDNPTYNNRRSNYQSIGINAMLWDNFLDAYDD